MQEKGFLYKNLPNTDMFCEGSRSSVHHNIKHLIATAMSWLPQATRLPVSLLFS